MIKKLEDILRRFLKMWIGLVLGWSGTIVVLSIVLSAFVYYYTANNLKINTSTSDMISPELPFRKTYAHYQNVFPQYKDGLVIAVEADTPEFARDGARILAERLKADVANFKNTFQPRGGKFLEENGLMFPSMEKLEDLADNLAKAQPLLASLHRDQSLRGLLEMLEIGIEELADDEDLNLDPVFAKINEVFQANLEDKPYYLSWQEVMSDKDSSEEDRRRLVITQAVFDYNQLLPASKILDKIHSIGKELDEDNSKGIRVRVTGGAALAHDELSSLISGSTAAGVASLILVLIALSVGLRSITLVGTTFAILLMGILFTSGFATLSIGYLNLISIAFAILYIGMGVDYAIHICLRYLAFLHQGLSRKDALRESVLDIGPSIFLCTLSTSIGFFAFVPTDYAGVSELGLISGTGMFISLFVSLTVLPAILNLLPAPTAGRPGGPITGKLLEPLKNLPSRHASPIRLLSFVFVAVAVLFLPKIVFEYDPLKLRDPTAESIVLVNDIIETTGKHPSTIIVLAKDDDTARRWAEEMEKLNTVDKVVSLHTFVPDDQEEKYYMVEDIDLILGPQLFSSPKDEPPTYEEQILKIRSFLTTLAENPEGADRSVELTHTGKFLEKMLETLESGGFEEGVKRVSDLEDSLMATLPISLNTLQASLSSEPFTRDELPEDLLQRWLSKEGDYRLQVFPEEDISDNDALKRFVGEVRTISDGATAGPVFILEAGTAIIGSFKQAFISAIILIALLLFLVFRNIRDPIFVLFPLVVAGTLTGAATVLLDMPFNFANIIALPLLLGLGVDNGVHMVYRLRKPVSDSASLLHTSTARGIFFSSLTTISSFGTLGFLTHRGTASMGQLLTLGVALTLLVTLLALPAFLNNSKPE